MKEVTLRKWQRHVGVSLMPLIVVQIIKRFSSEHRRLFGFMHIRLPEYLRPHKAEAVSGHIHCLYYNSHVTHWIWL